MSVRALADDGLSVFAFPTVQVVLGYGSGRRGHARGDASRAARRAARIDVVRAVATIERDRGEGAWVGRFRLPVGPRPKHRPPRVPLCHDNGPLIHNLQSCHGGIDGTMRV